MSQAIYPIEDEILRVLLLLVARRRSEGELEIDEGFIRHDLDEALQKKMAKAKQSREKTDAETEVETDIDTSARDQEEQSLVPADLLQLVLKPDLPAAVLEMIAKLLNNDPNAHQALVKLLTATSTAALVRRALTAVLAKCAEHGYSNALDVLTEALTKAKVPGIYQSLMNTIDNTSKNTVELLRQRPTPFRLPTPSPWSK